MIDEHLAPLLVGEPSGSIERLWDMMVRAASPYGATGLASYAISAIDLTLWDLKGKCLGRPVHDLIGGAARPRIPCYATGNDTDWHMELGLRASKLACPYGPVDGADGLARNEELIARTRALVGRDVDLVLDCWMAFDVEFTVRLAERLRRYDLRWFEDFLLPEDLDGYAAVLARLPGQGLAGGGHCCGTFAFAQAAARRLLGWFQPDIHWCGSLMPCLKICHLAEAAGIPVALHADMNTACGQHLTSAMPDAPWGEYFLGTDPGVPLQETLCIPGTPVPPDGFLVPSDAAGFGFGIDLDWIERMRL